MEKQTRVVCIGGGPAGLTASYLLSKNGIAVTVLEADPQNVGGISRTVRYKGFGFDIGGHRFFSKSKEVENLWSELLPDDLLERPRSSRIFYGGKFYSYPLKGFEALRNLGFLRSVLCLLSYAYVRLLPNRVPRNFEEWVTNQFGRRLFEIFFKTYTEKVWGMDCKEISADWAAQRIQGLSLGAAIWNALVPRRQPKDRSGVIKTLIESFRYPRQGPGMMWEAAAQKTRQQGGQVWMGCRVTGLAFVKAEKSWEVRYVDAQQQTKTVFADHVISSAPLREIMCGLEPTPETLEDAKQLRYRDFITVALVAVDRGVFSDNWIYVHDPAVKVGRIQNFKSWSPEMIPNPAQVCYGLEYFCFEGDGLWTSSDEDLISLAKNEMVQLGLVQSDDILDGCVVRQPKAYPVYDDHYAEHVDRIRTEVKQRYPGLHLVGRNGMHKYNNQDHAMMTAMLTVANIVAGQDVYDVWRVNQDAEYHESGKAGQEEVGQGLRWVPRRV